jgi:hypothetical protein
MQNYHVRSRSNSPEQQPVVFYNTSPVNNQFPAVLHNGMVYFPVQDHMQMQMQMQTAEWEIYYHQQQEFEYHQAIEFQRQQNEELERQEELKYRQDLENRRQTELNRQRDLEIKRQQDEDNKRQAEIKRQQDDIKRIRDEEIKKQQAELKRQQDEFQKKQDEFQKQQDEFFRQKLEEYHNSSYSINKDQDDRDIKKMLFLRERDIKKNSKLNCDEKYDKISQSWVDLEADEKEFIQCYNEYIDLCNEFQRKEEVFLARRSYAGKAKLFN